MKEEEDQASSDHVPATTQQDRSISIDRSIAFGVRLRDKLKRATAVVLQRRNNHEQLSAPFVSSLLVVIREEENLLRLRDFCMVAGVRVLHACSGVGSSFWILKPRFSLSLFVFYI